VRAGARFEVFGDPDGVGKAFGLPADPTSRGLVDILDWPGAISQLGIGICPLADTVFNSAKSHLKPAELSAAGVPWIASPRAEYRKLHALGAGLLAEHTSDWYHLLRQLLDSAGQREELTLLGYQVAGGLRMKDHAWRYMEAWEDACQIQQQAKTPAAQIILISRRRG
jgi:hypothetical protein